MLQNNHDILAQAIQAGLEKRVQKITHEEAEKAAQRVK